MKNRIFNILCVVIVMLLSLCILLSGCRSEEHKQITTDDDDKIVANIATPIPTPASGEKGEYYDENMALFGDFLKNVYVYECIYQYYKTAKKDTAYFEAVKLKTKLMYAINADCYLTAEEKADIEANAESYLEMQHYTLDLGDEFNAETVAKEIFGITFEQYKRIRLCESFVEKYTAEAEANILAQGNANESEIIALYENNKESYDYVLLRYISYTLNPGGNSNDNKNKVDTAQALCERLTGIEDMLEIIGSEGDKQSEGNSNGQITVYMNDTDNLFYEFLHDKGTVLNEKNVAYDSKNVYVAMCEGYYTWDNSDSVKEAVMSDYAAEVIEEKMLENILEYEEPEDWYVMSGLEEIKIAQNLDNYESIISKLKIAENAENVFLTVQDGEGKTSCKFYTYEKKGKSWSQVFKTNGYVGRSGIEDPANRVEGNGTTPSGIYSFGMLFGIYDNPGELRKNYKKLDNDDYWDGDRYSDTYNQYVKASEMPSSWSPYSSEHLIDYKFAYNYTAMINFNVNPTVKGKGSAIFLHCTSPGVLASAGCIAIPESKMVRSMRMIDDNAYIVIVKEAKDLLAYF